MSAKRHAYAASQVFDGERFLPAQAVIVEGDRIIAMVPTDEVPADVPVTQVATGTLLPGLIDTHVHFGRWQGPLYLAYGVTTVRDVGNEPHWILARRAEAHRHPWPRIVCVGHMLDGPMPGWDFCRACADADAACRAVAETAALGVDGIKLYPGLLAAWLPAMVAETRRLRLPVMMHSLDAMAAVAAGVEELFHLDGMLDAVWPGHPAGWLDVWGHAAFPGVSAASERAADRLAAAGTVITPTLAYWDFSWRIRRAEGLTAEAELIPPRNLAWLRAFRGHGLSPDTSSRWERALRNAMAFLRLLVQRGVPILTGTDEPWGALPPGRSLWREMELLADCGMTPAAVLGAATSAAARRLGLQTRGRIAPGYAADLVLVEADLARTGFSSPQLAAVVRDGQLFSPADLRHLAPAYAAGIEGEPLGLAFSKVAGEAAS